MHGGLFGVAVAAVRRAIMGWNVLDAGPAFAGRGAVPFAGADLVLQSLGNLGGMVVAGLLVVGLGLAAVTIWQGYASALAARLFGDTAPADPDKSRRPESERATPASGTEAEQGDGQVEPETGEAELVDEDVIRDILEDNGGRMKQARIVDATGWSKSKVSMLLSEMEEDGEVTKLRVGRENIVSLSGNAPDAAGSPFDSE